MKRFVMFALVCLVSASIVSITEAGPFRNRKHKPAVRSAAAAGRGAARAGRAAARVATAPVRAVKGCCEGGTCRADGCN